MRYVARTLLPLLLLLGATLVVLRLAGGVDDLRSLPSIDRPWLCAPALAALVATVLLYATLWRVLMLALDPARPPLLDSAAVFTCSWMGRLLPTSLAYVGGKVVLGQRLGHQGGAVAASIVYENLLMICIATITSSALLALAVPLPDAPPAWWLLPLIPCAAAMLALPSRRTRRVLAAVARKLKLEDSGQLRLNWKNGPAVLLVCVAAAAANGLSFALLLAAFTDLDALEFVAAAAAFNLAGAAGVAAVPVPSGIGVREAVLVAILQTFAPIEVAAAAAAVARLGAIPIDLALGAAGAAWLTARGRLRESRVERGRVVMPDTRAA